MADYYKGSVKQVTSNGEGLEWAPFKPFSGNEIRHSNIREIDTRLDTSRFHISLPILGEEIYLVDGKRHTTEAGEYFIFNPMQEARAEGIFKKDTEGYCIFITENTMLSAAQALCMPMEKVLCSPFHFPWQQQEFMVKSYRLQENSLGQYLARLQQELSTKTGGQVIDWDIFYFELATEFLLAHRQIGQHLRAIPSFNTLTKQEIYRRISLAHSFILEKYADPISLEDLEYVAFFSKYHIVRLYRQIYRITPYQHVLQLRMEKAKALLLKNYSPTDVAEQLSFSDRRAFSKIFKRVTGLAPSHFQEK